VTVSRLHCPGCGFDVPATEPYPFRCPRAGGRDDVDHVLARVLEPAGLEFPRGDEPHPFVRYRRLLHSYLWATARGLGDDDWCRLVGELDAAVAEVAGTGLRVTVPARVGELAATLGYQADGGVWAKDETRNPGDSHKIRHLFGIGVHLLAAERVGAPHRAGPLVIASCGNAALAAAIVARAMERRLTVFVPDWADTAVTSRLETLGADVVICSRDADLPGDPCVHAARDAVGAGGVPFGCQGPDNALALDGGRTIAWELIASGVAFDRLFVQVGGGALASSVVQGLEEAVALGAVSRLPVVHAVQTEGGFPIARAFERVSARAATDGADATLQYAASHRSEFMWPWHPPPRSAATGILDDEVYDWWAVVAGMLRTGGRPVVVPETTIIEATELARAATGIPVDPTGAAGLAGLLAQGAVPGERVVVLFTGRSRPRS
jgi:threonine synthase